MNRRALLTRLGLAAVGLTLAPAYKAEALTNQRKGVPPRVTVPNVVGRSIRDARAALDAIHLRVESRGDGIVVSQEPAAGTAVLFGTVVRLVSGRRPEPSQFGDS